MSDMKRGIAIVVALVSLGTATAVPALADIDMEFRPVNQSVCPPDVVEIGLFLVSDTPLSQSIASVSAILWWDEAQFELVGRVDNPDISWQLSSFPNDSGLDGLNDGCFVGQPGWGSGCVPTNDGNAYYLGMVALLGGSVDVPPEGLLITTFEFGAISSTNALVAILPSYGDYTYTRVMSGSQAGQNVLGIIGPPAGVSGCQPPVAVALGSRYFSVTPAACDNPVSLLVTGHPTDPVVSCVSLYIQLDGTLGPTPVTQTPAQWGVIQVRGEELIPGRAYRVQAECAAVGSGLSTFSQATLWTWADVNNDTQVDLDDILAVLNGFSGFFFPPLTFESVNLTGCFPDGVINLDDILAVLDAFSGGPFPCPGPC